MIPTDPKVFSLSELQALTTKLSRIAERWTVTELFEIVVDLGLLGAALAQGLNSELDEYTITPKDYAARSGVPLRTVQRKCRNREIDSIRHDGRNWRIRDDGLTIQG